MNERNVAYGGDSLYPRGREWNMSNRDNRSEMEHREHKRRESEEGGMHTLENPEHVAEAKIKHLQDLVEGGFHKDLGFSKELEDFVARGILPKSSDQDSLPIFGYDGPRQTIREHVVEDPSGARAVETGQLLQFLSRDLASKALAELGIDAELPGNWDSMDVIHKGRWLQKKKGIFSFKDVKLQNDADLVLPEIRGASDEVPWKDPLMIDVHMPTSRDPDRIVTREINVRENLDRLIFLANIGDESSEDYIKLKERFDKDLEEVRSVGGERNYQLLSDLISASDYLANRYTLAGRGELLEKFISGGDRRNLQDIKNKWNADFRKKYTDNPEKYESLFRKLKEESAQVISIQDYGLYGKADDYREKFELVANGEINAAVSVEDREMLRWRKVVLQEGFDTHFAEKETLQPTADWRDSEKNLDQILRFLESTEFDEQQLSAKLGAAAKIVQGIPVDSLKGHEKEAAERMQKHLTEKLQAILAVNSLYGAAEHSDLNPEKVLGVAGHLKDDTFELFFKRFNRDAQGNEIVDSHKADDENNINILSIGMNVYMRRLNFERKVFNHIENWTKNPGIQPNTGDADLDKACTFAIATIEESLKAKGSRNVGDIKDAIKEYHKEYTMLGSHDEHHKELRKQEMVGVKQEEIDRAKKEGKYLWTKGIINELKTTYNLSDEKVQELIDSGTIDQVMNNAYKLSWLMAFSEYDGIRVWDPNEQNPVNGGPRVVGFVYSGSTHLFHGRMVDHGWEFMIDEARGKVGKTNYLMQDGMLGERGNLLPQNRALTRWARDMMPDVADAYLANNIHRTKNIDKFDIENSKEERGWANSAVLSEGIDSGELALDKVDWMKFFKTDESWKYKWVDLYGDRKAMMDYMGAGVLQNYLKSPNSKTFFQINSAENFYSKREVRLKPWMKLAIPVHIEIGKKWKQWWHLQDQMPHAEKEDIIDFAVESNRLDAEYDDWMKSRYLGWGSVPGYAPVRLARQLAEASHYGSREGSKAIAKTTIRWPFYWGASFVRNGFKYVLS